VLGANNKPVYASATDTLTTHGAALFNDWWTASKYGKLIDPNIQLILNYTAATESWTHHAYRNFFPINGQGWGDELADGNGNLQNFGFTMEFSEKFTYTGKEYLTINADDDLYVYVNGQLVINHGGVHEIEEAFINFTTLGLPLDKTVQVWIFFTERHTPWCTFNMTTNIFFNNSLGAIGGDPHFVGLQGERYDVDGEPNKWFNLVSDVNFQLNAHFVRGCSNTNSTALGSIAMIIGDQQIFLNITCDATLNGTVDLLEIGSITPIGPNGKYGVIHHALPQVYYIDTPDYYLRLNPFIINPDSQKPGMPFYGTDCILGYFNLEVDLVNQNRKPHGLLGQTAHHNHSDIANHMHQGEGEIEGVYTDYIVSGPYENDFRFNRYRFDPNLNTDYEDTTYEGTQLARSIVSEKKSKRSEVSSLEKDPLQSYWDLVKFYENQCVRKNQV
jgi:fibro-slime domain-containing protein